MDKPQGGYSHFFFITRLGPSIYRSSPPPPKKKKHEFQAPQINIWSFSNQTIILHFVPWPSEKILKCIEMTSKYSPILWLPPKNIHTLSSENPPKYWNSNFLTPKNSQSLQTVYVWKYQSTPSPHPSTGGTDGTNMKDLPSSQIWNLKYLLLFDTSHKNAC